MKLRHVEAALAVWRYCEISARLVYGITGSTDADRLLDALEQAGAAGLRRERVGDQVFSKHGGAGRIDAALAPLAELGLIVERTVDGRSARHRLRASEVRGESAVSREMAYSNRLARGESSRRKRGKGEFPRTSRQGPRVAEMAQPWRSHGFSATPLSPREISEADRSSSFVCPSNRHDRSAAHRRELAERLDVSTETVLRYARRGDLPAIRLPGTTRGRLRFRESGVEEWLERTRRRGGPRSASHPFRAPPGARGYPSRCQPPAATRGDNREGTSDATR